MKETIVVYKGRKLLSKRLYLVDYTTYGFPEWNRVVCEHELRKLLEDCEKYGWVRPEVVAIKVVEVVQEEE